MTPSFLIATFGCKVNQYDSQVVRESLAAAGCREVHGKDTPDLVIINTCTVTGTADSKARRLIRSMGRRFPDARIVVTGCLAERDAESVQSLPGVWRVIGNGGKADFAAELGLPQTAPCEEAPKSAAWRGPGISDFAGHTRAFVKVQDGCDAGCSYCIVPSVRGRPRSRPMADVVDEVRRLVPRFQEIVLTGVHVGRYRDESGAGLAALVRAVLDSAPPARLRLSSIEVNEIEPELLDLAATRRQFCPHFHVPLQSGSDEVLRWMNRRYTAGEYLAALDRVRARLSRPAVTTDVIVGFPVEGADDFNATAEVCRAAGFARMHIFPYSARPGTAAEQMGAPCAAPVVSARKSMLEHLARELALAYKSSFVGETVDVLVETERDASGRHSTSSCRPVFDPEAQTRREPVEGRLCGYTDRYLRVLFDGSDDLRGRIVPVRIERAEPEALLGGTV